MAASANVARSEGLGRWWTWHGDIDGDHRAEALLCASMTTGACGHPMTALFVFTQPSGTWRPALATVVSGGPIDVFATVDGIVGTFRQHYQAGSCLETRRHVFGWQDGQLVQRSEEVVDRVQNDPAIACSWPTS